MTIAVSPIFSPVLPNFRFVGETKVAGVVGLGGELRFFNKREGRRPEKRMMSGILERWSSFEVFKNGHPQQRVGWSFVSAKREAGTIEGLVEKGEKREDKSRARREARLIKDPRFVFSLQCCSH